MSKSILGAGNSESNAAPDPYDLASLQLTQDFLETAGVKKHLRTVPVRKPNPQDFNRVHPDPAYRANLASIVLKDDREVYLVHPQLLPELSGETVNQTFFTAINRQGVLFLWPVRIPDPDGRQLEWWVSAREGAELAMTQWVRLKSNTSLGAYEITTAETLIADPVWPELSFQEIIRIAFKGGKVVDTLDHPVIKHLRGLA